MEPATALAHHVGVSLQDLRPLVGHQVSAETEGGSVEGTLLSCTARSAWIVVGDVDHVVALPRLLAVHRHPTG